MLSGILLLASLVGKSQQQFSLAEARAYALEHNYQAKNATYEVELARRKVKETIAIGLPQVSGSVSYNNYIEQPVQLVPAEFFGGNPGEFQEVVFATEQNATADLTARQLLFDGSYIVGLQATKAFVELSNNQKRLTELEVIEAVSNAYQMVLVANENVALLEQSLQQLKKLWKETEAMYESGFVEESDVDQLAINYKNVENSFNNAQVQAEVSLKMLKFQLGLPFNREIVLTDEIDDLALLQSDQGFFETTFDVMQNANYKLAATNLSLQGLNLKKEKSAFLPQLSMFATHQQNAFANDFNFLSSDAQWFPTTLVGVSLNVPIFSSGMRMQKVSQAKIVMKQAEQTLKQARQGAELELLNAKAEYNNALAQYRNEKSSLALAEKIKQKTAIKYQEGIASSFELTQAETQYLNTQGQYIQATFNLLSSKTRLDKALNNF